MGSTLDLQDELLMVPFNNALWRVLLSETCGHIDTDGLGLEIISPWGFEVFNQSFLSKPIRRFYCYIGVPEHCDTSPQMLIDIFWEILLNKLEHTNTQFLEQLVILIKGADLYKLRSDDYICKSDDKLLDIQLRFIKEDMDILTDYAHYIMTSLAGLLFEKSEASNYQTDCKNRRRLYQLYLILESLFGYLLPKLNDEEIKSYRSVFLLTDNSLQIFYSPEKMHVTMNPWEDYVIHTLIMPRLCQMHHAILGDSNDTIALHCEAYHTNVPLQLTLDKTIYSKALGMIRETYLNFI